ncbi:unnamed protein product, partial [Ectocarpus sp. 6 AP-2014]
RIRRNKGRWTHEEHAEFLRGVELYKRSDLEAVASMLPTRTIVQVRTHAQKYFDKVDKGEPFPNEPYPSQYDRAAGRAGVAAGAYMYSAPKHEPQQQQDLHHLRRHQLREQQHAAGSAKTSGSRRPLLVSHSEEQQRTAAAATPAGPPKGGGTGGKSTGLPHVAACTQAYGDTSDANNVVAGGNSGGGALVSGGSSGQSLFPNWSNSAGAAACAPGWFSDNNGDPIGAASMPMPVAPDLTHGGGFDGCNFKLNSMAFYPSARFLDELQGSGGGPGKGFAYDESFQQPQQEQEEDFPVGALVDMPLDRLLLYGDSGDGGSVADSDGACANIDLEFDTVNGFGLL